jgi:hypothetical protein
VHWVDADTLCYGWRSCERQDQAKANQKQNRAQKPAVNSAPPFCGKATVNAAGNHGGALSEV